LLIKKRIANISTSFPVGDWLFNASPVTLLGNNSVLNYNGILYGDANGSYTPASGKSVVAAITPPSSDAIFSVGSVNPNENDVIVPVYAAAVKDLGSFQFTLQYDSKKLVFNEVTDWNSEIANVVCGSPKAGQITFVWAADTKGIEITDGLLCNLHFTARKSDVSEISWSNDPTPSEFGDYQGRLFTPALKNGTINSNGLSITEMPDGISVTPNPGKDIFTVICNPSIKGAAVVKVVNTLGQVVFESAKTIAGQFSIDLTNVTAGNYYLKVENAGTSYVTKLVIR